MPAPLIPIAIAMAGRAAVSKYLAGGAGAAALKATNAGKAGKAVKGAKAVRASGNRKRPSGSSAGKSTNSAKNVRSGKAKPSGSPAAKPKKITGQTNIPKKVKALGLVQEGSRKVHHQQNLKVLR